MFERYNRRNIIKGLKNPTLIKSEFGNLFTPIIHSPRRVAFQYRHNPDDNIMNEDWDNLIILDACRHDVLTKINKFKNAGHKILKSSNSLEFIENYFSSGSYDDTVYVTANPFGAQVDPSTFHKKIVTFDNKESNSNKAQMRNEKNSWSQSWSPETVYQSAIENFENNPNKRIVIHFMQPHGPYFGEKAKQARDMLRSRGFKFWAWNEDLNKNNKENNDNILSHLLPAAQKGLIEKEPFIEIYKENLAYVLEYVDKISNEINGKTIVTADHGEMLGEKKICLPANMGGMAGSIGHGYGIYVEELRKVPWVILNYNERRTITQGENNDKENDEVNNVDGQLKALGYK
jgi:hypothetical protein